MKKCDCGQIHDNPFGLPDFDRRDFLKVTGAGFLGYALTGFLSPVETVKAGAVDLLNTARTCIFINLNGGPSQVDTFDVKEGVWTPEDFDIQTRNGMNLPRGLFPNLFEQTNRLTIARAVQPWTAVHAIGQYYNHMGAQNFNPAFVRERPPIGAVVAYEYSERRRDGDVFPGFVGLNANLNVGAPVNVVLSNGFLSARYAPFLVTPNPNGVSGLTSPLGEDRFNEFYSLLYQVDAEQRGDNPPYGRPAKDYGDFYIDARSMMYNPVVSQAFQYETGDGSEAQRYAYDGSANGVAFGNACIVARNLVTADKGTAFVQITLGGWDNHVNIYGPNVLYKNCATLDTALSNLISDLSKAPGRDPKKTALDETLIVLVGDFGRTPSGGQGGYTSETGLNNRNGRDHWQFAQFAVLIGGGVIGGRVLGATDEFGNRITEFGWDTPRPMRMEDVGTTIYSALGIDYTKEVRETPSGRPFRYVWNSTYKPIVELFR